MSALKKEYDRIYQRKFWRKNNGWPESMIDAPPEPRKCREGLYHQVVDALYSEPDLQTPDLARRFNVSRHTITNTLRSRRTSITEIRQEAREAMSG